MDFKKQSHLLKSRAKELGYEIKLTHAQELVATILGHKSRHSALLEDKINVNSDLTLDMLTGKKLTIPPFPPMNQDKYYYYKITLENNKVLYLETIENVGEDCEFLHIAWKLNKISANERDVLLIQNVLEITKQEFYLNNKKYFYEIHVIEDLSNDAIGYSLVFSSTKQLTEKSEIIEEAKLLGIIDSEDSNYVDYTEVLDESTYNQMGGI
jgi:hypothetical protein